MNGNKTYIFELLNHIITGKILLLKYGIRIKKKIVSFTISLKIWNVSKNGYNYLFVKNIW